MPTFEIVCLANSRKPGGRCVAGMTDTGEWIRPVSPDSDGSLQDRHYRMNSGKAAEVLDVIRIQVDEHVPEPHQPENWRVTNNQWEQVGRRSAHEAKIFLRQHSSAGPGILGNQSERIGWEQLALAPGTASLTLIEPRELSWKITTSKVGKRQTRAIFRLAGIAYDLPVTDPVWEARLGTLAVGSHPLAAGELTANDQLFFTISLGDQFQGSCYKLVAAVIAFQSPHAARSSSFNS